MWLKSYPVTTETVGLRELRKDASGLVRRVELGEEILITVSGRASAKLVPPPNEALASVGTPPRPVHRTWRPGLSRDRVLVDDSIRGASA